MDHAEAFASEDDLGVTDEFVSGVQWREIVYLEFDRGTEITGGHGGKDCGAAGKIEESGNNPAMDTPSR